MERGGVGRRRALEPGPARGLGGFSAADPELAARWAALEQLPRDSIGRKVWELYQARGFTFPGTPGSAPPLLAQHDWVHVLADYGTTVESEVEVFGLIARANDDLHAFSLLAMVISLFETGYLATGAGLFESSPGHFSSSPHMADAPLRRHARGAPCATTTRPARTASTSSGWTGSPWPMSRVLELRGRFHLVPKSAAAVAAGSVGTVGARWHQPVPDERRAGAGRLTRACPTTPTGAWRRRR